MKALMSLPLLIVPAFAFAQVAGAKPQAAGQAAPAAAEAAWTESFSVAKDEWASTGRNPFFVLEPGYQLYLESAKHTLTITVLDETKVIDGVETRVVEEREAKKDGTLKEVS